MAFDYRQPEPCRARLHCGKEGCVHECVRPKGHPMMHSDYRNTTWMSYTKGVPS
jgi:hypothetical protein